MATTNFENANLRLLIEDTAGIVTTASLTQKDATPSGSGIGGSIADQQVAFGNGASIAGNSQFLFEKVGNVLTMFLQGLQFNWDDDAQEATIGSSSSLFLSGTSIRLGDGQSECANTGLIRLEKLCAIKARNHAGNADLSVLGIGVDGNDYITLGDVNSTYVLLNLDSSAVAIGASSEINISTTNLNITANVNISSILSLTPTTAPSSPAEGMIYAGTDHHLHYYNGTAWKQLDN